MALFQSTLFQFAISSPIFLVWIVGIVLAALRLHESRFRLVLVALIMLFLLGVSGLVINSVLPITLVQRGLSPSEVGGILSLIGVIRVVLESVAWCLVLIALFLRPRPSILLEKSGPQVHP